MSHEVGDVTEWLARWQAGQHQALDHIVPLVTASCGRSRAGSSGMRRRH